MKIVLFSLAFMAMLNASSSLANVKQTDKNDLLYKQGLKLLKKPNEYNLEKAYDIFEKAANNNHAPSLNMVGQFLVKGVVVKKDYSLAFKVFEKASKQNYEPAHCNLAFMYANGKGTLQNLGRAHAFAKDGYKKRIKRCVQVWEEFNLEKFPNDGGWKFNSYTKPN